MFCAFGYYNAKKRFDFFSKAKKFLQFYENETLTEDNAQEFLDLFNDSLRCYMLQSGYTGIATKMLNFLRNDGREFVEKAELLIQASRLNKKK